MVGPQTVGLATEKCWAGSEVLQAVDDWQVLPSVDTCDRNAVVRQVGRCAAVQTPVNCHCQLEKTRSGTSSQWSSSCSIWPRARSNFQVLVTTRAAAFNTCCNLSVTVLGEFLMQLTCQNKWHPFSTCQWFPS